MKQCPCCKRLLSFDCFYKNKSKKDGLQSHCKNCRRIYCQNNKDKIQIWNKRYRQNNKTKIQEYRRKHYSNDPEYRKKYNRDNKDKLRESRKKWRANNKEKVVEIRKKYREKNKDKIREYCKKYHLKYKESEYYNSEEKREWHREYTMRQRKNPKHRLNHRISHAIWKSLRSKNISKNGRQWESFVNFTLKELMIHIESLFQEGMTWENQGEWHLDHVKPISLFNFESINDSEFKECWNLKNLQPLWAVDNLRKNNRYIGS